MARLREDRGNALISDTGSWVKDSAIDRDWNARQEFGGGK